MLKTRQPWRIGIIGIYHESNTFIDQLTTQTHFERGHLFFGKDIIREYEDAHHEIGGMIKILREHPVEIIPLMYAEATPGGIISKETGEHLVKTMREVLDHVGVFDGLMVVPHGAAVSEDEDDFDGYWLSELRSLYPHIPIVGTLDPHANVSERMVAVTDALIAYKTNPHVDQRSRGSDAAALLLRILNREVRPLQKLLASKVVISIEQQYTGSEPCLGLYQKAELLERKHAGVSISILLGFPYADVLDMGTSFLVITNEDEPLANVVLQSLEDFMIKNHRRFSGAKTSISQALEQMVSLPKPVLLLDMGDNVGGGSPGDSTFLLDALEKTPNCKSFICIKDPQAVKTLSALEPGDRTTLTIGGKSDNMHGFPFSAEVQLRSIVNGTFKETEPRHGGQVHFDMGKSAIVQTANSTTIMLTTLRIVPFSLQQLLQFGIQPESFDAIVAKGVQAPIAAYAPVCPSLIRVNTKGVTTADMKQLQYQKRRRPLFPFEPIESLKI